MNWNGEASPRQECCAFLRSPFVPLPDPLPLNPKSLSDELNQYDNDNRGREALPRLGVEKAAAPTAPNRPQLGFPCARCSHLLPSLLPSFLPFLPPSLPPPPRGHAARCGAVTGAGVPGPGAAPTAPSRGAQRIHQRWRARAERSCVNLQPLSRLRRRWRLYIIFILLPVEQFQKYLQGKWMSPSVPGLINVPLSEGFHR